MSARYVDLSALALESLIRVGDIDTAARDSEVAVGFYALGVCSRRCAFGAEDYVGRISAYADRTSRGYRVTRRVYIYRAAAYRYRFVCFDSV